MTTCTMSLMTSLFWWAYGSDNDKTVGSEIWCSTVLDTWFSYFGHVTIS